jgi:hypothetical protein
MLKDRVAELKTVRDQTRANAERTEGTIERLEPGITPRTLKSFARTARKRCGPRRAATAATISRAFPNASEKRRVLVYPVL